MMFPHVVLLGAAGSGVSFGLATALRRSWGEGVRLVGIDIYDRHLVTASVLCDDFYKVPLASSPEFPSKVSDILLAAEIDTFVPIVNDEFRVARNLLNAASFSHVDFVIPADPGVDICLDKLRASEFLNEIDVPCPPTYQADFGFEEPRGSWFLKPRNSFGSRGAQRASTVLMDSLGAENKLSGYIVQSVCTGPEVTVDCFSDATLKFLRIVCRERLETKSGVSTKARLFHDGDLANYAQKIANALEIRGAFCFQVMRLDGVWVVTDLNLRPGAATAMSVAVGQDMLSAHFACRWNEPYEHFFRHEAVGSERFVTRQYAEFVMNG